MRKTAGSTANKPIVIEQTRKQKMATHEIKGPFITELLHDGKDEDLDAAMPYLMSDKPSTDELLLMKARRELAAFQARVDQKKKEMEGKKRAWRLKENELLERQAELKTQVSRFQKFVAENNGKKARAEHKARREVDQLASLEESAQELRDELAELTEERTRVEADLAAHRKYEEYIDQVSGMTDAEDVIFKHQSLSTTHDELQAATEAAQEQADSVRAQLNELRTKRQTELLANQNQAARLSAELDRLRDSELEAGEGMQAREARQAQTAQTIAAVRIALVAIEDRVVKAFRQKRQPMGRPSDPSMYPALCRRVGELVGQYQNVVDRAVELHKAEDAG